MSWKSKRDAGLNSHRGMAEEAQGKKIRPLGLRIEPQVLRPQNSLRSEKSMSGRWAISVPTITFV